MKSILLCLLLYTGTFCQEWFEYSVAARLNDYNRLGLSTKSYYPFNLGYFGLKTTSGEIGEIKHVMEYNGPGNPYTSVGLASYFAMGAGLFSSVKLIPKLWFDSDLSLLFAFSHGFWARPTLSLRTNLFKNLWLSSSFDYTFSNDVDKSGHMKEYYENISVPSFSVSISYQRPTNGLVDKVIYNSIKYGGIGALAIFGLVFAATFHG